MCLFYLNSELVGNLEPELASSRLHWLEKGALNVNQVRELQM